MLGDVSIFIYSLFLFLIYGAFRRRRIFRYLIAWEISYYMRQHKANWHFRLGDLREHGSSLMSVICALSFLLYLSRIHFWMWVLRFAALGRGRQGSRDSEI